MIEEKSVFKNSVYNVAYKLLNVLFPLISATYASHIILAFGMGKVSSAQNIVSYFVVLAALGIPNYGIREISKVHDDDKAVSRVFSELILINFVSTIVCTILYFGVVNAIPKLEMDKVLYNMMGLTVVLNIFNVDWYYQGKEEYRYIAKRSFMVKVISLAALFLFVRDAGDYICYAGINILATAGNYLFNTCYLYKKGLRITFKNLNITQHLKPVLILLCTTISIELYTLLDTTMLTFLCEEENVGYYANSMKVVKMLITLVTAIGGVLLPRLSYYYKKGKIDECSHIVNKVLSVMMFLFLPCGIGLMLTADLAVPVLFGESFIPAIITMRLAALLVYALGFSNLFGTQVLITFSGEKELLYCTLAGAVSNMILNMILIPMYAQNGATVASVISEGIVTLLTFGYSRKYIRYHLDKRFVEVSCVATVIMAGIMMEIKQLLSFSDILELVIVFVAGIVTYLCVNVGLHNPIVKELRELFGKRKR